MSTTTVADLSLWLDSHVQTLAIRNLAKSDIQDGTLGRGDMLGIFKQVEQDGLVSSPEFSDLKAIVGDAALFDGADYVEVLSSDVVLGSAANAHYQGTTLGNLAAGSGAAKLQKLANKWFLGMDHPIARSGWRDSSGNLITFGYRKASGQLFVNSVDYTDIDQGGIGDCYFLSSLAETALKDPDAITSMFIVNGDGTYTVRFMHDGKAAYVTVDSYLPTDSSGRFVFDGYGQYATSSSNELWAELAEKAYVQINECGWIRTGMTGSGKNVYNAISGGYMDVALNQITGDATGWDYVTDTTFSAFAASFNSGQLICLGSKDSPSSSQIVGEHAYAVVGVSTLTQTITVFNPWGLDNGHDSGIITLSWTQIRGCFDWFGETV